MALEVDEVAAERLARRAKEVVEADVVERRGGGKTRNVAAEFGADLVRAHDGRKRVPAHDMTQARFEFAVAGHRRLAVDRNRVDVRRRWPQRYVRAGSLRFVDQGREQLASAPGPFDGEYASHGLEPFASLLRIGVGGEASHRCRHFRPASPSLPKAPACLGRTALPAYRVPCAGAEFG